MGPDYRRYLDSIAYCDFILFHCDAIYRFIPLHKRGELAEGRVLPYPGHDLTVRDVKL